MMLRTHLTFSLVLGLLLIPVLHLTEPELFLAVMLIAAGLPDIDYYISFLGKIFNDKLLGHRGIIHSLLIAAIPSLVLLAFSTELALAYFIGYCSHLVLDSLTPKGIRPLLPFSSWKVRGFITTGSWLEQLVFVVLVALAGYLSLSHWTLDIL